MIAYYNIWCFREKMMSSPLPLRPGGKEAKNSKLLRSTMKLKLWEVQALVSGFKIYKLTAIILFVK